MSDTIPVQLQALGPYHPKTQEIVQYLRDQLQLPIFVREFTISFSSDAPIAISCSYMPFYKEKKDEH